MYNNVKVWKISHQGKAIFTGIRRCYIALSHTPPHRIPNHWTLNTLEPKILWWNPMICSQWFQGKDERKVFKIAQNFNVTSCSWTIAQIAQIKGSHQFRINVKVRSWVRFRARFRILYEKALSKVRGTVQTGRKFSQKFAFRRESADTI